MVTITYPEFCTGELNRISTLNTMPFTLYCIISLLSARVCHLNVNAVQITNVKYLCHSSFPKIELYIHICNLLYLLHFSCIQMTVYKAELHMDLENRMTLTHVSNDLCHIFATQHIICYKDTERTSN